MQWKTRTAHLLAAQIAQESKDPDWAAGFADAQSPGALSAPPMARGHQYALGYLTALLFKDPPSGRRH